MMGEVNVSKFAAREQVSPAYLLLWLRLVAGATAGAAVFRAIGLETLWIAVVEAALLLAGSASLGPTRE